MLYNSKYFLRFTLVNIVGICFVILTCTTSSFVKFNMEYTVGSLAELISGKRTENKQSVIAKEFKVTKEKTVFKKRSSVLRNSTKLTEKHDQNSKSIVANVDDAILNENDRRKEKKQKCSSISRSERRLKKKMIETAKLQAKTNDDRTVFVGNMPITANKLKVKKLCSKYGDVESVRFRGIPVTNLKIPWKVALMKRQFHPKRTSINCYVK